MAWRRITAVTSHVSRGARLGVCLGGAAIPATALALSTTACKASDKKYVLAIDQGTTSSRAILFDGAGTPKYTSQHEFTQIYPQPGWAEHNPEQIMATVTTTIQEVMRQSGARKEEIAAIGITNQRETTVAWDRTTGKPLCNALVWLDLRTAEISKRLISEGGLDRFREKTGLPVSTYFSAVKMRWMIENVPAVAKAVEDGRCMFGTIDSWLVYNLTGGTDGGIHTTDCTNASRYMLMNLKDLKWDDEICKTLGIPTACLPQICSNSEELGRIPKRVLPELEGVPITCSIGDQHGALLGQACLTKGEVKSTYGTGCFIVMNTGTEAVPSKNGLLTTMSWKLGKDAPAVYALEGAVATAGRGIQWLRDSLKLIQSAPEINGLAGSVPDAGGVVFVPAFSGLLAPHWRPDARGALLGLSLHSTDAHVARAMLDGILFQAADVKKAMLKDAGLDQLKGLKADGGMSVSDFAMQIQADQLGAELYRARMAEASALGAAFGAGLAVGFWSKPEQIRQIMNAHGFDKFTPKLSAEKRHAAYDKWQKAVKRSFDME